MNNIVKKSLIALFAAMFIMLPVLFGGCSAEKSVDGKYFFTAGGGAFVGGPMTYMNVKNDDTGLYEYIVGGIMDESHFWIELKDGTMIVNGSITHIASASDFVYFNVNPQTIQEHSYTLKTSATNEMWYEIWINDEWSLYSVSKSKSVNSLIFNYKSDSVRINYTYDKK